jgi:ribosomal protein L6P/L9E
MPNNWSFSLYKLISDNLFFIFFYSKIYFFFLPLNNFFISIKFNKNVSCISFLYFYKNNFFLTFFSYFKRFFYTFSKIFFRKLKFKGKGYYIYKNKRNTIALQFGYSHIKRLFFFYNFVRFLSKTSIIIFGFDSLKIAKSSIELKNTRPINLFTGKGVRFNRQIIYRKTGKISNYR